MTSTLAQDIYSVAMHHVDSDEILGKARGYIYFFQSKNLPSDIHT